MSVKTYCDRCGEEMSSCMALDENIATLDSTHHICKLCLGALQSFIRYTHTPHLYANTTPCGVCGGDGFVSLNDEMPEQKEELS